MRLVMVSDVVLGECGRSHDSDARPVITKVVVMMAVTAVMLLMVEMARR